MSLHKPEAIKPLKGFRLWVRFDDGTEGVTDLSDIAGHGVFAGWAADYATFLDAQIAPSGEIVFRGDLDICADAIYHEFRHAAASAYA